MALFHPGGLGMYAKGSVFRVFISNAHMSVSAYKQKIHTEKQQAFKRGGEHRKGKVLWEGS